MGAAQVGGKEQSLLLSVSIQTDWGGGGNSVQRKWWGCGWKDQLSQSPVKRCPQDKGVTITLDLPLFF